MADTELEQTQSTHSPRLRLAKTTEENLLACVRHSLWGSPISRFKDWRSGDRLAFQVGQNVAGLADVTGPAFVSQEKVWKDKIYPYRIPIRFVCAMRLENQLSLGRIKGALASAWDPIFGTSKWPLGIKQQAL